MEFFQAKWNSLSIEERKSKLLELRRIAQKFDQITAELVPSGLEDGKGSNKVRRVSDWPDEEEMPTQSSDDKIVWDDDWYVDWNAGGPIKANNSSCDKVGSSNTVPEWPSSVGNDWFDKKNQPDWGEWPFNDPDFVNTWNKRVDKEKVQRQGSVASEEVEDQEDLWGNYQPSQKWKLSWDDGIDWADWN